MPTRRPARPAARLSASALVLACALTQTAHAQTPRPTYPEGVPVPAGLTPLEAAWMSENPIIVPRSTGTAPVAPITCPGEYAPMEGLIIANEGGTALTAILREMTRIIVNETSAKVWVIFDTATERDSELPLYHALTNDDARVVPFVRTTDSIWMRDYGPRYAFEGNVRVLIDHTYNRPRPNDDAFPTAWGSFRRHARYTIPLIHGGGNYHLDSIGRGHATNLIVNENPSLTPGAIVGLWNKYQGVNTTLYTPFPANVDSTQHIDMWMQVVADDRVLISDWPLASGSAQDVVCDNAAASLTAAGYSVTRIPAVLSGGVHYTYTNSVMMNNVVLVPTYTNATASAYNAQAVAAWETALAGTGKVVRTVNCQDIVGLAGVMHCIVMHVPAHRGGSGGLDPTVTIRSPLGGVSFAPNASTNVTWVSDDDVAVTSADVALSIDGGLTYPISFQTNGTDSRFLTVTIPNVCTTRARVRVTVRDADGRTASSVSPSDFTITGTCCPGDFDGNGTRQPADLFAYLNAYFAQDPRADVDGNAGLTPSDIFFFLNQYFSPCV